ncbi:xanthine/CO dehydrogenase XdhC/CoxF family maturation factor [Leeuwenhoekiella aestuarii]|uniref:Xanthine/CO dehydrogenase XdhC/CoxF family maturation factor n=1 Tax=Leeuwenhoekiella aestuarii TaxID=2249426 RepID=A0A4Q0NW08_9FLAO|nr:XdhC/CoxI family protein [Leeuwenhoekiella aestuarii]RXG15379.1 xanthine/CO dehydrogenase XdhC/CoxF family maturation factor [Leeuwenhoekiella aestuarii]RXG17514.1 xanthine/CO dehydrogenase XdhC/CoxF family maturation factor [Leeuwenhoekiella aestuarii]
MTHEFKELINTAFTYYKDHQKCVMASVVDLDGSSYRKPGVRMLISESGIMTGAVSGGCVEKEVLFQAQEVFETEKAKMMTYDGRYRLGCEGVIYILIEPVVINDTLFEELNKEFKNRTYFKLESFYKRSIEDVSQTLGTQVILSNGEKLSLSSISAELFHTESSLVYKQELPPLFQVFLFGSEHDAVQLGITASQLGWQVTIIASPKDPKTDANFPGVYQVLHLTPQEAAALIIDEESAVVLMNHNYATDLNFLVNIIDKKPNYIGVLGSSKRREKLFNELIDYKPELFEETLDTIYGPAGIDIGAITPQEIALSVTAEILALKRKREVQSLRDKNNQATSKNS